MDPFTEGLNSRRNGCADRAKAMLSSQCLAVFAGEASPEDAHLMAMDTWW
jgi:hypothetical protein